MPRDIWAISDPHFGHQNIIKFCNRPFADVAKMNEALIENINSCVKDGDILYVLGDVYFGQRGRGCVGRLNGRKRLILGNHDDAKDPELTNAFQKIMMWRMFPDMGLLLTHVPVYAGAFSDHSEERAGKYDRNVHGHTHTNFVTMPNPHHAKTMIADPRYINVSCDVTNFKPVNLEEIRTRR